MTCVKELWFLSGEGENPIPVKRSKKVLQCPGWIKNATLGIISGDYWAEEIFLFQRDG